MKRFLILVLIHIFVINIINAEEPLPDLNQYNDLTSGISLQTIFFDDFYYLGEKKWKLENGITLTTSGSDGFSYAGGGMFYNGNNTSSVPRIYSEVNLKPDYEYELGFDLKWENLQPGTGTKKIHFAAVFFYDDANQYCGGAYSTQQFDLAEQNQWHYVRIKVIPDLGIAKAKIVLYLQSGYSGEIIWDNVILKEKKRTPAVVYTHWPKKLKIPSWGGIQFGCETFMDPRPSNQKLLVEFAGNRYWWNENFSKENDFTTTKHYYGELSSYSYGELDIKTYLLDTVNKNILSTNEFKFFNPKPINTSSVDKYGRIISDGEPFMPIGMYGKALDENEIQRLKNAGFNCFLPEDSMTMTPVGGQSNNLNDLLASLNLFEEYNLKVIFSVCNQLSSDPNRLEQYYDPESQQNVVGLDNVTQMIVRKLKKHSAILAWLVAYNNPYDEKNAVKLLRETVCQADSNHAVTGTTFDYLNYAAFASSGDILGTGNFPICDNLVEQSMLEISNIMQTAKKLYMPMLFHIQAYNLGLDKTSPGSVEYSQYRWPTATEICAMTLCAAINGAKGFIFNGHEEIFTKSEQYEPGSSQSAFDNVKVAVNMLNELKPFILSTCEAPQITINSISNGKIEVKAWANADGQVRIAVVGLQKGLNEGEFSINCSDPSLISDLTSKNGLLTKLNNDTYKFQANNISYDILF